MRRARRLIALGAVVGALRRTGATMGRSDVLWEKTEPSPPTGGVHHCDWRFNDTIGGALAVQDPTWLPILDYAANRAKTAPSQLRFTTPHRPGVRHLRRRFRGGI